MAYLTIKFSRRPPDAEIRALRRELEALTEVQEPQAGSFGPDIAGLALIIGLSANALQVVDILNNWFQRAPKGNEAVIRLSDGRTFEFKSNTDAETFAKQLKAALKDL
jgi:hypothetical protein